MTPRWAEEYVEIIKRQLGIKGRVILKWRKRSGVFSTGRTWYIGDGGEVHINAGSDRDDTKMIIIHELCHVKLPHAHHTKDFWDLCWKTYRWAKLPMRKCFARESRYKKRSVASYYRVGKELKYVH